MKTEITQTTNTGECTIDIIYEMHPRLAFSFRDKMSLLEAESFKAVIKDYSKGNQKLFQRRLIIWAAWNSSILIAGYYLATGTLLGAKL